MRRQWAATEAQTYGWGGLSAVSIATGMSRNTIRKGLAELAVRKKNPKAGVDACLRRKGVGTIGGTDESWRSAVAVALDLQEHDPSGRRINAAGTPHWPVDSRRFAEGGWL